MVERCLPNQMGQCDNERCTSYRALYCSSNARCVSCGKIGRRAPSGIDLKKVKKEIERYRGVIKVNA